jgi:FtsZ-interacting cell division protein ZipA
VEEAQSVRSGSGFWAAGHDSSHGSSAFSATQMRQLTGRSGLSASACASGSAEAEPNAGDDSSDDSDGTEIAASSSNDGSRVAHGASSSGQAGQPQQQQQQPQPPQQQQQSQQQQQQQQQQQSQTQAQRTEDVGAQDAFIAGMIYALSRRLLPGAPYAPGLSGATEAQRSEQGRWKLDECLRYVPPDTPSRSSVFF